MKDTSQVVREDLLEALAILDSSPEGFINCGDLLLKLMEIVRCLLTAATIVTQDEQTITCYCRTLEEECLSCYQGYDAIAVPENADVN